MHVSLEFGGAKREFAFRTGQFFDLEQACGVGVGTLYKRLATSDFHVRDVKHILKQGLIGGGMPAEQAESLVMAQLDLHPLLHCFGIASDVFLAAMSGLPEASDTGQPGTDASLDQGAIFHALMQVGVTPAQVRNMRFDDFQNLLQAAAASKDPGKDAPTEDEFNAMIAEFEQRQRHDN